jgi:hypothetical protein
MTTPTAVPFGMLDLDHYPGSDDDRLDAALGDVRTSPFRPTVVFRNRKHVFNRVHPLNIRGLRISGPLGGLENEYGSSCRVQVNDRSLFRLDGGGVKDVAIRGVSFAGNGNNWWLEPTADLAAGPLLEDLTVEGCGWSQFKSVMRSRLVRARIDRTYTQGCSDVDFTLAGSDSWLWPSGNSFMSSTRKGSATSGAPYLVFEHMSVTTVGSLYLTPEGCRNAVLVKGSFGGLRFDKTIFDGSHRAADKSCQYAAVHISGGRGVVLDGCRFFNVATARDASAVVVVSGGSDHVVRDCEFVGRGDQPSTTAASVVAVQALEAVPGVTVSGSVSVGGGNAHLLYVRNGDR